jgi:hypothetical protein
MTGDVSKRFRLGPEDEYPHAPDASPHYNESVYANAFDLSSRVGGWMRLGNRINEGVAEVSVCLYLPGGRLACLFAKPSITTHEQFSAGGLTFRVDAPLSAVTMTYDGDVFVLADPALLRDPKAAFGSAARARCTVDWHQTSLSPAHGGEPLSPEQPTAYGRDFSLGHFNLHTKVDGRITVGDEVFEFRGHGWRDHSWGPRYWQNLFAHRLLTASFGDDLGLMIHKIEDRDGAVRRIGTLLVDGRYEDVEDLDLVIDWNARREPSGAQVRFRTAQRRKAMSVKVLSLAPLRNRREAGGVVLESRILEAAAEFRLDGRTGYGMFELVERLEDGVLAGFPL